MPPTQPLRSIDLFSGAGGMSEGFRRAGFTTVVATDFDEMAGRTFRFNHPGVPFLQGDIREIEASTLLQAAGALPGTIDVVCGGPPCQMFSLAGPRIADDPRNRLFLEFVRVVKAVEPKFFLFENVVGLVNMQQGDVLRAILREFSVIGYELQWKVLNAADYGVPQARPRFVLVGNTPSLGYSLPKPSHLAISDTPSLINTMVEQPPLTVWDALSDLPAISQGEGAEEMDHSDCYDNPYQEARRGEREPGRVFNHRATSHSEKVIHRYSLIPEGCNNSTLPPELRTKKTNVFKLDRRKPARTVTCNHRTDLLHPTIPRGTTVREAARLQSFDDDYRFFGNLTRKAAWVTQDDQVGNAVPPLLAEALANSVIRALEASMAQSDAA